MSRRWIRLDVTWEDSGWLDALPGEVAGCWPRLLCTVKRDGVRGRCRRPDPDVLARRWRLSRRDVVTQLEQAAIADGALVIEDGDWVVVNWSEYQDRDKTAAQRKRKQRSKSSNDNAPAGVTDGHGMSRRDSRDKRDRGRDPSRDVDVDVDRRSKTANAVSSDSPAAKSDPRVAEVFAYWLERTGRDPSRTKLTQTRRQKIQARLRRFTPEDLLHAIDGVMLSDHHRKKPEWTDLVSCFGNDEKVEAHIERWRQRGRNGASAPPPAGRKQQLREALEMVRRHDPQFAGGLPDLWDHAFEVPPRDYALWNEVLREAGLSEIPEVA